MLCLVEGKGNMIENREGKVRKKCNFSLFGWSEK